VHIEEIHVDGFGLMHGHALKPSTGLTVVRGMNETGKTTLLAFVRAILFGFETNRHRALAGGRRGGWLSVRTREGREFRIERYGETGGQGRLRVLDSDDRDLGAGELPILLQGVDQRLFRNVFAFGLDELAQFERLTDSEVAARIYGAGLGLGAVSALEVENRLGAELEALFKPGGQIPCINALLRELECVDDRLRRLDLPAQYADAVHNLRDRDARLGELAVGLVEASEERRRSERLRDAWEPWLKLCDALARRDALGPVDALPIDLPERLAALETRRDDSEAKAREAEERRASQAATLEQISVDEGVVAHRAEIAELVRSAEGDRTREKELEGVEREIGLARRELGDALLSLGPGWSADLVETFDDSVSVQTEISGRFRLRLDRAAATLASTRATQMQIERDLAAARTELEKLGGEIAEIVELEGASPDVGEQERRLEEVEMAVAARDAAQARAEASAKKAFDATVGLERTMAEIADAARAARALRDALVDERQTASLLASLPPDAASSRGRRSARLPLAIGSVGLVAALVGILLGAPLVVGALIVVAGLIAAAVAWRLLSAGAQAPRGIDVRRSLTERLAAIRESAALAAEQLGLPLDVGPDAVDAFLRGCAEDERARDRATSLQEVADGAREELERIESKLSAVALAAGLPAPPVRTDLDGLRDTLANARDRRSRRLGLEEQAATLHRRIEGLESQAEDARGRATEADAEEAAAQSEWSAWLRDHGLDPGFDRETAKTVIDAVTAAKRPHRSLTGLAERATALEREHEAFIGQAMALVLVLGWQRDRPIDRSGLDRLVAELDAARAGAVEADRARRNALALLDGLVREEADARAAAVTDADALAALLAGHSAADIAALRTAIGVSDAARSLDDEIAEYRRTLTALSGPGAAFDRLAAELERVADIAAIDGRLDEIVTDARVLSEEQARIREEAGALRESIAAMERDVAATADRQRKEDLLAQLESRAEQWSVLALGRHVLAGARAAYEAAHRPAVIEAAERYFEEWTTGRYRRILAPLGRQVEEVEHRDGTRVPLASLSTGTAQQLYLALRFGLVEHFAETAEPLPIVMDDILVNFDDQRAALAARSIERLAERQQVIYFTCHPETPLRSGTQLHLDLLETVAQTVGSG
jgi:uncharacterized protein YhaN